MATVWLNSSSPVITDTLTALLHALGYGVQLEKKPPADLAIWDCSDKPSSYPVAPLIPTLALVRGGGDEELARLLLFGYRGYLLDYQDGKTLGLALEALARGELWASQRVVGLALKLAFGGVVPLTVEQARMVTLSREGRNNWEIAKLLDISKAKVDYQLKAINKKLGDKRF